MTTYYVGPGGSDSNDGTTWQKRKLTLNGAEDIPVAAGDTVYVAPGTYRELLTCDVSGSGGSPIVYIGDYDGSHTSGVKGVVRITGSDNDQTATRANAITSNGKNYRTFKGFLCDLTTGNLIQNIGGTNFIIDGCALIGHVFTSYNVYITGTATDCAVRNCLLESAYNGVQICFYHSANVDNANHVVENCIGRNSTYFVRSDKVGGITCRNNVSLGAYRVGTALTAGQTMTVNNCVIALGQYGFSATATGEITEDYNALWTVTTPRTNTNTGSHSNAYPPLHDMRWFFQALASGNMLVPWDLASYSQLVGLAGTAPSTTDLRGTAAIGGVREWGPLEYDSSLYLDENGGASYPAAGDVRSGTVYGGGTGTLDLPAEADVQNGVTFDGTSKTGTFAAPAAGDVQSGVTYGSAGEFTGTLVLPTEAQVESGIGFGADGTEFTGSLSGSGPSASEIADAVLDELLSGHTGAGSLGKAIADILEDTGTTLPAEFAGLASDEDMADAVWNEARSGHTTAGSYGATSEWASAEGITAQEVRDSLKLAPSAGTAAAGSVDAHLDALIAATAGSGTGTYSDTITDPDGVPLDGVLVQLSTDAAGAFVAYQTQTNAAGVFSFRPDPGTYYLWLELAGYAFTQGAAVTVTE